MGMADHLTYTTLGSSGVVRQFYHLCVHMLFFGESWARPGHIKLPVMCENGLAKEGSVMPLSGDQW